MLLQLALAGVFLVLAIFWVWFFLRLGEREKEPKKFLLLAFGAGVIGAGVAGILDSVVEILFIVPKYGLEGYLAVEDTAELISNLPFFMLLIGAVEEIAKFGAVRLTIYRTRFFDEIQDGVLYFGMAGLGFALAEDLVYMLGFGSGVAVARVIFFTPFHPATAAIVGYFAARQKIKGESAIKTVIALLGMIVIHALHNFLIINPTELIVPLSFGIILFLYGELYFLWKHSRQEQGGFIFCPWCGFKSAQSLQTCPNCFRSLPKVTQSTR